MASNKKVSTPSTDSVVSFKDEILTEARIVESKATEAEEGRKGIMARLAAQYGAASIKPASEGGLSGNALRDKENGYKAEASRLGITEGAAKELHAIMRGINELRANVWQSYQRAYFGVVKAAPKEEPEAVRELKAQKAELAAEADQHRLKAKTHDAWALKSKIEGNHAAYMEHKEKADAARKACRDLAEQSAALTEKVKTAREDEAGINAFAKFVGDLSTLGNRYAQHNDKEVRELAKAVLALIA